MNAETPLAAGAFADAAGGTGLPLPRSGEDFAGTRHPVGQRTHRWAHMGQAND